MSHSMTIILMVVLTSSAASAYPTDRAPATVHYMNLNPTSGAYAFGYTAANSAREERRSADGIVEGKYSYLNPQGKLISVIYGADKSGFQAIGDHLPPVDTPEVKLAKEKFMNTYAKEMARISTMKTNIILGEETDADSNEDDTAVVVSSAMATLPPSNDIKEAANSSEPPIQNWIYSGTSFYVATPFLHRATLLFPLPLTEARVAAVHDAQVPNYAQRNAFYARGNNEG